CGIEFMPYKVVGGSKILVIDEKHYVHYKGNAWLECDIQEGKSQFLTGSGKNVMSIKDPDRILSVSIAFNIVQTNVETASKLIGGEVIHSTLEDSEVLAKKWTPPLDLNSIPNVRMNIYTKSKSNGFSILSMPFVTCGYP